MADVFEPRIELDAWRDKLWSLIEATPKLDWLLLTKRPGHIKNVYPWVYTPRRNVWLGTTAENQRWARQRIPRLLSVDAYVRFLSCEPLLAAVDLTEWLNDKAIDWVIAGGESGAKARPTHPNWIRSLRDQCKRHRVPFHFKQWGHWSPDAGNQPKSKSVELLDEIGRTERLQWLPKKLSGRVLDGQVWDGYPT
jgi:protein gp37